MKARRIIIVVVATDGDRVAIFRTDLVGSTSAYMLHKRKLRPGGGDDASGMADEWWLACYLWAYD